MVQNNLLTNGARKQDQVFTFTGTGRMKIAYLLITVKTQINYQNFASQHLTAVFNNSKSTH